MLFPTFTFAVFFVVVYGLHVALRRTQTPWKVAMLGASAVFYGWWDPRFCALIAVSILGNWAFGNAVDRAGSTSLKRWTVRACVASNLVLLGFFKYYGFFALSLIDVLGADPSSPPLPLLSIVLPVGISFFTFQALSYVLDIGRGKLRPASLLDVGVYLSFFPQLVAGPIVRASEFLPQMQVQNRPPTVASAEAIWLIARGLFKKVVISTYLAQTIVDDAFSGPASATKQELWVGMYGYAIQIYADFSGYTDIAIGIALLLGFRFPQNFDNPYRATSIQDFWRRWHQTLSTWLRDYLYIPLGGNRGGTILTYRNLALTMVLGGLWHGAAWTFVIWGAVHGAVLVAERLLASATSTNAKIGVGRPSKARSVVQWVLTFHIVCIAWVFFRAASLGDATDYIAGLVTAPSAGNVHVGAVALIMAAIGLQFSPPSIAIAAKGRLADLHPAAQGSLLGVWIALVVALGPQGVSPFIYFQF